MNQEIKEVWYACYGSNIREERFLCYINGGTPPGAVRKFKGCTDKTQPRASRKITINREMYFAKKSITWNGGGICFLKPGKEKTAVTLGRRYLISTSQFIDLVRQELKIEGEISIDFGKLLEDGSFNCMSNGRYGLLLYLGELEGRPIVTFTSEEFLENEINSPNIQYLSTIVKGLKEVYDLSDAEITEYLRNKTGIKNFPLEKKLQNIVKAAV